jgi:hypothetical protein
MGRKSSCPNSSAIPSAIPPLRNHPSDDPDPTLHPLFPTATYQEVILSPGDMLYIPRLSWHYVRAVEPAVNVSMWWGARMGLRERGGAYKPVY